jgi:hypothetical protein
MFAVLFYMDHLAQGRQALYCMFFFELAFILSILVNLSYRALCKYFGLEPKVINGPELIDSLVGKSERAVQELFEEATIDQLNVSN